MEGITIGPYPIGVQEQMLTLLFNVLIRESY